MFLLSRRFHLVFFRGLRDELNASEQEDHKDSESTAENCKHNQHGAFIQGVHLERSITITHASAWNYLPFTRKAHRFYDYQAQPLETPAEERNDRHPLESCPGKESSYFDKNEMQNMVMMRKS